MADGDIDKVNELIAFTGPSGAYGCTLGITFPSTYNFPIVRPPLPSPLQSRILT